MADREAIALSFGDGWCITLAGIRRERGASGNLTADVLLIDSNDRPAYSDRATIQTPAGRQAYAQAATGAGRPDADTIESALLALLQDALATVQDQPQDSQADRLVDLVNELAGEVALWHDTRQEPWASIQVDGHTEHWPLASKRFKRWLARRYFERHRKAPNAQSLTDAINVLAGQALYEGKQHEVCTRIAEHDGRIYLDLADDEWQAVEIGPDGWQVVSDPPPRFRRPAGMLPLPAPEPSGSVDLIFNHLNVNDEDRPLVLAWLVQALRPSGPYPILPLYGEQGSAKTTTARALRALIDPSIAPARSQPREERDLMIAAQNGAIIVTDNVSNLPAWLSDAYCRLATGGGLSTRQLYTDGGEIIFDAQRPAILTGIEQFVVRGDMLDRSIPITLPEIPEDRRKPEGKFWEGFNQDRPKILGVLLDRVVTALQRIESISLDQLPRMADFALWAYAAAPEDERDRFIETYQRNRNTANETLLDGSLVAAMLLEFMDARDEWTGNPDELLTQLTARLGEDRAQRLREWPKTGRGLRGALDRVVPGLRRVGIEIDFNQPRESGTGRRMWKVCNRSSQPSRPSPRGGNDDEFGQTGCDDLCDGCDGGEGPSPRPSQQKSPETSGSPAGGDDCDDCDGRTQPSVYESMRACSCGNRWYRRTPGGEHVCVECGKAAA